MIKCKACLHEEACASWIRHGEAFYDDFEYSVEDCPYYSKVVHGKNLKEDWPSLFECSVCGCDSMDTYTFEPSKINYCPSCGAKMDGGK